MGKGAAREAALGNGRWLPPAVFLLCSVATFWFYGVAREHDNELVRRRAAAEAAHIAELIGDRLETNCRILERYARRWERATSSFPDEWRSDIDLLTTQDPSWEAVAWIDTSEVVRWIVFAHGPGANEGFNRAEAGRLFPIDVSRKSARLAMASHPRSDGSNTRFVSICAPILRKDKDLGFVGGLLRVDVLLNQSLRNASGQYAVTLAEGDSVIFGSQGELRSRDPFRQSAILSGRDLSWLVLASPLPGELRHLRSDVPLLILVVGLSSALLLAAMTRIVQIAHFRTNEVSRINGRLQTEMRERLQVEASLKRQSAVLRESEARFRSVTESANEAIVIADQEGTILSWNKAAEKMFGLSEDAAVGRSLEIIMPERHSAKYHAGIARMAAGADSIMAGRTLEIEGRRADGSEIPIELSVSSWTSGGRRFMSGMMRDIAHRRANEEQVRRLHRELESRVRERTAELKRSNEDLQQFAYVASHDLQEPLRVVSSFTQLLARRYQGKLGEEADEFISFAVDGCQRMQHLINDLMVYCRVDTAGEFGRVDCGEALDEALANLSLAIVESGATIQRGELPVVEGDRSQIVQLFQNLIGNAVKFRGENPPEVRVSAHYGHDSWTISIEDNGIGIDPRHADRIFVIFQRLHGREEYKGTGIGLSICKKIVERHGGRIWVESEPGRGSVFRFTLRAVEEQRLSGSTARRASM